MEEVKHTDGDTGRGCGESTEAGCRNNPVLGGGIQSRWAQLKGFKFEWWAIRLGAPGDLFAEMINRNPWKVFRLFSVRK